MTNATLRANARPMPERERAAFRRDMARAAERLIALVDLLDALEADLEPTLGATDALDQRIAWHGAGDDREDDPAEAGFADADGLAEQTAGEPSLGATFALDQRLAWQAQEGDDGEATGTEEDVEASKPVERRRADRQAAGSARDQLRAIVRRRSLAGGLFQ